MDPTLVPGTRFESQFQICVYEHAILRIYISFFSNKNMMQEYPEQHHDPPEERFFPCSEDQSIPIFVGTPEIEHPTSNGRDGRHGNLICMDEGRLALLLH